MNRAASAQIPRARQEYGAASKKRTDLHKHSACLKPVGRVREGDGFFSAGPARNALRISKVLREPSVSEPTRKPMIARARQMTRLNEQSETRGTAAHRHRAFLNVPSCRVRPLPKYRQSVIEW
jgi:hypothetical protein